MATHSSILAWRIPMDRGAWWATVHETAKSQTRQSDQTQQHRDGNEDSERLRNVSKDRAREG